jgi:hypothetical protein
LLRRAFISLLCLMSVIVLAAPAFIAAAAPAQAKPVAYNLYFGDLHTHTGYSDAYDYDSTPWDAYQAAIDAGADFMAVTDHWAIWHDYEAWVMNSEQWIDARAAADFYTSKKFVAMAGYEAYLMGMCGEINVYNADVPPAEPEGYKFDRLSNFYDWLANTPGAIGQFNHPQYVSEDFLDFTDYTSTRDIGMGILEVYNDEFTEASYVKALDAGWHVMPSANSDTHISDWISGHEMRTVLLAPSLTPANLYSAMSESRGYATLDKNLRISFTVNGMVMGSILSPATKSYSVSIHIEDPDRTASDAVTMVELVSDGGQVVWRADTHSTVIDLKAALSSDSAHYYYLRVTTQSGIDGMPGVTAWTSPVWTGR